MDPVIQAVEEVEESPVSLEPIDSMEALESVAQAAAPIMEQVLAKIAARHARRRQAVDDVPIQLRRIDPVTGASSSVGVVSAKVVGEPETPYHRDLPRVVPEPPPGEPIGPPDQPPDTPAETDSELSASEAGSAITPGGVAGSYKPRWR